MLKNVSTLRTCRDRVSPPFSFSKTDVTILVEYCRLSSFGCWREKPLATSISLWFIMANAKTSIKFYDLLVTRPAQSVPSAVNDNIKEQDENKSAHNQLSGSAEYRSRENFQVIWLLFPLRSLAYGRGRDKRSHQSIACLVIGETLGKKEDEEEKRARANWRQILVWIGCCWNWLEHTQVGHSSTSRKTMLTSPFKEKRDRVMTFWNRWW